MPTPPLSSCAATRACWPSRGRSNRGQGAGTFRFEPRAEYVSAMQSAYGTLPRSKLLSLAILDVSRKFVQDKRAKGYDDLTIERLIRMRIHGKDWLRK